MSITKIMLFVGSLVMLLFVVGTKQDWLKKEQTQQETFLEEQVSMAAADGVLHSFRVANPEPQIQAKVVEERFQLAIGSLTEEAYRYSTTVSVLEDGVYEFAIKDTISEEMAVTGVRCVKRPLYLVSGGENGTRFYHREGCRKLPKSFSEESVEAYYLAEECASVGAYPCPSCLLK